MKKRILTIAMVFCLMLCLSVSVFAAEDKGAVIASGKCGENVRYTIYESGLMEISGTGDMENIEWLDYPPYLAEDDKIKKVVVHNGVSSIGDRAFYEFENLTSIELPKSVKRIGDYSFYRCDELRDIILGDNVKSIGEYAFYECNRITELEIPNGVTYIGNGAFEFCINLERVSIPDSVYVINPRTFKHCYKLKEVIISDNVKKIDSQAFYQCSLTNFSMPQSITEIGFEAFSDCDGITSIVFSEKVTNIENQAFAYCSNLNNVIFEGNAPNIGKMCFYGVVAKVYYPAGDETWTESIREDYEGKITWVSYKKPIYSPNIKSVNVSSSGKIKLTWNKVNGAVEYKVYRATSKTGKYSPMKTVTGTSYTNTSAKPGKYYYYYVVAIGVDGTESKKSNVVGRTCDYAQPVVTATNDAATGKPKLTWKAVEGATSYKVYRATTKNGSYTLMKTVKDGTTYINANAATGKMYYYKVKAYGPNSSATSVYSVVDSRTCDLKRPVVSITTSSGKPKISWAAVTGAKEYKIYRATSKNGTYKAVYTTKNKYWKDTTAKKGKTYYYRVVAVHKNSNANSAKSVVKSIKCTK